MPSGKALKHLKSSSGAPDGSTLQLRVCYCEQVRLSYDQRKKKKKRECRRFERVQTESSASVQFGKSQNQESSLTPFEQTCRRVQPTGRSHCKHVAFKDFPAGLTTTTVTQCASSLLSTEYLMLIQHASVMLDLWTQQNQPLGTGL